MARQNRFGATHLILIGLLLVAALALRLYGLDWDNGALFHPDERAVLMKVAELRWPSSAELPLLFDAEQSPLNPRWFAYGSLPLYMLKAAAALAARIAPALADDDLRLVGRALAALADVATVLLTYRLGLALAGRAVGLLGAAFTAFTVLHIQQAHFFVVDVFLVPLLLLALLLAGRIAESPRLGRSAALGAISGLALATKVSAFPVLALNGLAHVLYWHRHRERGLGGLLRGAAPLLTGLGATACAFVLAQPYAVLDWPRFWADIQEQRGVVTRALDYPYTRQYIGTAPYLYPMVQLALWGLGLPLGVAAGAGALYTVWAAWKRPRSIELLVLAYVVLFFGVFGALPVKFLRYYLPIIPVLNLWAARALLEGLQPHPRWRAVALVAVLGGTMAYAMSYTSIYARPHPAHAAAAWLREHAPPGARVLQEHWEEPLPGLTGYAVTELPLYEPDTPEKLTLLATQLAGADFLVFYSHRLYATIPRLPERYPLTTAYYRLLFSGQLGYELAHMEVSFPSLGPIALADDPFRRSGLPTPGAASASRPSPLTVNLGSADESFTVYDHPQVLIFQRSGPLAPDAIAERIQDEATRLQQLAGHKALLSAADAALYQSSGTWRELFPKNPWTERFPLLAWLIAVEGMWLLGWALAFPVLKGLPDRGYLLSKALGPLLVAYGTWLLASVRLAPFSPWSTVLVAAALGLFAALLNLRRWREWWAYMRQSWPAFAAEEVLFLLAFGAFVAIRMANPDLWHPWRGGEKPMDLAFLTAIVRSPYMPPFDPWLSGGSINYYYWGHFLVATVVRLTGIEPTVAYNLAVPWLFALTVAGAAAVVSGMVAQQQPQRAIAAPLAAGLIGALFVAVLSNVDGALQLIENGERVLRGEAPLPFDYWRSSRMLPGTTAITEFPFFTFLFADLHAHLIALPLTLLALGLAVALLASWEGALHQALATVAMMGLVVGALAATNGWDFPTYTLLTLGAIALWTYRRWKERDGIAAREGVLAAALFLCVALLAFVPFYNHYEPPASGLAPSPERTPLARYLAMYGPFLFSVVGWGIAEARKVSVAFLTAPVAGPVFAVATVGPALLWLAIGHTLLPVLWLLLAAAIALLMAHARLRSRDTGAMFALVLVAATLGLSGLVEVATVEGDIGRMNTVFKLGLQTWVLLALASAYALARMVMDERPARVWRGWRSAWLGGAGVLLMAAVVYPIAATPVRIADRFVPLEDPELSPTSHTLDGMAYMRTAVYPDEHGPMELRWDYEAIRWLQQNVEGSPVIVEAVTPLYRWGGRYSVYTGLPAIAGWDWHERQQRPKLAWLVEERQRAVATVYGSADAELTRELLRRYGVKYVIVGPVERAYYPTSGLAKLAAMPDLRAVYQNPGVTIYAVASLP